MSSVLKFEDGELGGDIELSLPNYKDGMEFSGIRKNVPTSAYLEGSSIIFIGSSKEFIKYNQISAYRWNKMSSNWQLGSSKVHIEMSLVNPRFIEKEEGLKELI